MMNMPSTQSTAIPVIDADQNTRAKFIMRTYNHLFAAILAFAGIEIALFKSGLAYPIAEKMLGTTWIIILGAFMIVSWLASHAAARASSMALQYLALGAFVVAEAIIFIPLLFMANVYAPGAISSAAWVTLFGFAALSAVAFTSRKDFSFLGGLLKWGGFGALGLIGAGFVFGFDLGTYFSVAMVFFAGAAILYDTSKVLYHYPEDRYVGAALELFASVALMFWYVLRIFIAARD